MLSIQPSIEYPCKQHLIPFFFCNSEEKPLLCLLPSETILQCWVPKCEDASIATVLLWINLVWLMVVWNKYSQLINVQFVLLWLNTWWNSQKAAFLHLLLGAKVWRGKVSPQHSCEKIFPDWCIFEFTTSIVNLSMFSFNYYDLTLDKVAKKGVSPHCCCWVPKC